MGKEVQVSRALPRLNRSVPQMGVHGCDDLVFVSVVVKLVRIRIKRTFAVVHLGISRGALHVRQHGRAAIGDEGRDMLVQRDERARREVWGRGRKLAVVPEHAEAEESVELDDGRAS